MSTASTAGRGERMPNPATLILAVAIACSTAMLLGGAGHVVFTGDEWTLVVERRGFNADAFFDPHVSHLIAGLVAAYKGMFELFGLDSPLPFRVLATAVYMSSAVLLFVYARRRVGDWLALFGAILIVFYGSASQVQLYPFMIFFSGSVAAGLGALLALDRDDRLGDVLACVLLVASISFSETGICFVVGAALAVALGSRPWTGRLYVPLVPLALYGIWWLGWGHTADTLLSIHNVLDSPRYVLEAAGAAIASLLGLASSSDALEPTGQHWGPILAAVAIGLAAWRLQRLRAIPPGVWVTLAIGLTFWLLAAFNTGAGRDPGNGRYLYASGVLVILIASELLRGVRPSRRGLTAAATVTALAVAMNLQFLYEAYNDVLKHQNESEQALLRALEDTGELNPDFVVDGPISPLHNYFRLPADDYLAAVDQYGSPAYSEAELAGSPPAAKAQADLIYVKALRVKLRPGGSPRGRCVGLRPNPLGAGIVSLAPGAVTLQAPAGEEADVEVGRYSDGLSVAIGRLTPGATSSFTIPADRSPREWKLGLVGSGGAVRVCGTGILAVNPA